MEVLESMGAAAAYVGIGIVILVIGYVVTDLTTPGHLTKLIYRDRSANAAIIAGSNLFAIGIIVNFAIWVTHDDFLTGLWTTAAFGLLGVVLLAVADFVIDMLVPGDLRALTEEPTFHPATVVIGLTHVIVGTIIAASIV